MGISPLIRNNPVKEGGAKMHRSQFVGSSIVLKKRAVPLRRGVSDDL